MLRPAILACLTVLAAAACSKPAPEPKLAASEPVDAAPADEGTQEPVPAPKPRAWIATRGSAKLELFEGSGPLVDSNAPPPPPGITIAPHPFIHGSCGGDTAACSLAYTILEATSSPDAFVEGLRKRGFEVRESTAP